METTTVRHQDYSGSTVSRHRYDAAVAVLADREAELLELKGPCSDSSCPLHRAHRGPHAPPHPRP